MLWKVPRMWEGGTCIIIGGGPSILKQFNVPDEIVSDVHVGKRQPSAYSPYLEPIHKHHVIAVNVAYKIGAWIDMMIFGDSSTWSEDRKGILEFRGLKVTCADMLPQNSNSLKYLGRDPKKRKGGISTDHCLVGWNKNSGAAAMNLAVHTGVKRIILLGFDMRLDSSQNQHWHKFYTSPLNQTTSIFNKHLAGFPQIKKDLDALGIEVLNANPDSAIEVFKKVNFKDIKL